MMRHNHARTVIVFTAAVLVCPHFGAKAAEDSLETVFRRMDQASRTFKSLKANMKKVKYTSFVNEQDVENGTIRVKVPKPGNFQVLIDFTDPDPKKVALDGVKVQIYYPKQNAIEPYDLGKIHKNEVEQFVLLGFGSNSRDLQSAYTVKYGGPEIVDNKKTWRIELYPKNEQVKTTFPKFELWISEESGISIQQKVYETGEKDYSLATYTNVQVNPPGGIPDSEMKLNAPKDAKKLKPQKE
jgi:outer membrane lipoprotein-sorting protein